MTVTTPKILLFFFQTTHFSFPLLMATKSTKPNLLTQMANLAISNSHGNNKENLKNSRPLPLKSQEIKQVKLT
jgi:hypothetical protein